MENKHIRCESYILYFLNYFEIPISEYSLGKIDNKKISVLEKDNGYLIYDLNSQNEKQILVDNFFDVIRVIYKKVINKNQNSNKLIKTMI